MGRRKNFENELAKRLREIDEKRQDARRMVNVGRLTEYFGSGPDGPYDGSCFETFDHEGSDEGRIGASDLVAVTLLSMEIRRGTTSGITPYQALRLEQHSERVSQYLAPIPARVDLHTLSSEDFEKHLGSGSYGESLWNLLRKDFGLPEVATYKLMARKRPQLFPIRDTRAVRALGGSGNWWRNWYDTLRARPDLVGELEEIRRTAALTWPAISDLSVLRVADIVLWKK